MWSIAFPAILTNVATALFGLADMWAIGRLGDPVAQGAVELGAKFMVGLLAVFNFLRTGTVALTAQAAGRGDAREGETLARAFGAGIAIAAVLLLAMPLAISLGLDLLGAGGEVRARAAAYIGIRYWSAPLWLANCVLVGWFIGKRRVRTVLVVEVAANVVHIALDLVLVLRFGWGVEGVAAATVLSEGLKLALLAGIAVRLGAARDALKAFVHRATWRAEPMKALVAMNRDLFARTLLLTGAILIFARSGAQQGPVVLAANGILFQVFMLSTLILDGFENASQVLCGEAFGARDRARFRSMVRTNLIWGGVLGLAIALVYALAGASFAASFSTDDEVRAAAARYMPWVALMPLAGFASFVFDGIFVGAAWTRAMLGTMLAAIGIYVALLWIDTGLGNDGLWLAFTIFFVARGLGQAMVMPRLVRRDFSAS